MNSKVQVGVVHVIDRLSLGGAEEIILTLAKYLDRGLYRMEVACLQAPGPLATEVRDAGVPVTVFRQKNNYDPTVLRDLIPFLRKGRFAICHTHMFAADFWGRLASLAAGVPIRISSIVARNVDYSWKNHLADRVLARWTDHYISNSSSAIEFVRQKSGIGDGKFTIINNPIDLEAFLEPGPDEVELEALRSEWGISLEDLVVGCIARLHRQKGHVFLLRAMKEVLDRVPEARLLLVGGGPLREHLEAKARQLDIFHRVTFCGYDRRLRLIYSLLDVKVLASLWEGNPLVLVQAMLSGVPVVATSVDGIKEIFSEKEVALLVPPEDPKSLADAIVRVLSDPVLKAGLVKRARDFAFATFDARKVVRQYEAVYRACLEESGLLSAKDEKLGSSIS